MSEEANAARREIEKRLLDAAETLMQENFGSLDGDSFYKFADTLKELVSYHETYGDIRDTVIGFEALNAYLIVVRRLNGMLRESTFSRQHIKIREKLDYIETLIDEIISEGYGKMYYDDEEN